MFESSSSLCFQRYRDDSFDEASTGRHDGELKEVYSNRFSPYHLNNLIVTHTVAKNYPSFLSFTYSYLKIVKPELRTAITSHRTFSVLKRYSNLVEIGSSISPMPHRFRVKQFNLT